MDYCKHLRRSFLPLTVALSSIVLLGVSSNVAAKGSIHQAQVGSSTVAVYVPEPLPPVVSADGLTLANGVPARVLIADPNPSQRGIRIPAPQFMTADGRPQAATASIVIDYVAAGGEDAWAEPCYEFPAAAKTAFNAAAAIWSNLLQSSVPIHIRACWANLGGVSTLGYSGGGQIFRDFAGAPVASTWYTKSLADALAGSDLSAGSADMHITYNSYFSWYYGTDGVTPVGQWDLMTVVLHEIAHGLNFAGTAYYDETAGTYSWGWDTGYPSIYDRFVYDASGHQMINTGLYPQNSAALGSLLTSNNLWFRGSNAMAANGGTAVKMYAPSTWLPGSSYSHLDYSTFAGTANSLMVYAVADGSSKHDPGPVTKAMFKDFGWTISSGTTYTLSVQSTGTGSVPIVGSPTTYSGTTAYTATNIAPGTSLTLTAPKDHGHYTFAGWSGCDTVSARVCQITMNANKSATVAYRKKANVAPTILLLD